MIKSRHAAALSALFSLFAPAAAFASEMNGSDLSFLWAIPFAGILLSIAICPLVIPHIWHNHFGKISAAWAVLTMVPLAAAFGFESAAHILNEAIVGDYIPFILFVGTLFVVAGGIHIQGNFSGKPMANLAFLLVGAGLANIMGTTGAAMLLIRPLLKATEHRKYRVHTFVFFIFIVANIGGCLTPLGDPPLFMGFLRGVDFFWTAQHTIMPMAAVLLMLSAVYLVIDTICWKKENPQGEPKSGIKSGDTAVFRISGGANFVVLCCVVGGVLVSGFWDSGFEFSFLGVTLKGQGIARDCIFLACAATSLAITPKEVRSKNQFSWDPVFEVAKLFAGIFVCMGPVLMMLRAGADGAFAPLVSLTTDESGAIINSMFFWLTGGLSSFLDNTPTYLAFFNLAGGDPVSLMGPQAETLLAISIGAVFMGAVTYIGNAPNFMVLSIAKSRGVNMPSFFGYMIWSICILVPIFFVIDWLFLM